MATLPFGEKGLRTETTKTILQDVLVIGVGRELRKPDATDTEGNRDLILTLALSSEEAEQMALAQSESHGQITVVVRPKGDHKIKKIRAATLSSLR